jgi:hypothetical protein
MGTSLKDHQNKILDNRGTLAIDSKAFTIFSEEELREQLQAFARSTRIEVDPHRELLLLRGSDLTHHTADPHLHENIQTLPVRIIDDDYAQFHAHLNDYDLCMEDSWTGYFVARCLSERVSDEPLVFIHLDDHTDMMSTLLVQTPEGLKDPSTNTTFNPIVPQHWKSVISSGAVGIGSFVTALYYLKQPVHVMHLNHALDNRSEWLYVAPHAITQPLMPRARFVTIFKQPQESSEQLGTYTASISISHLLTMLPQGRVIVHIDLDYFINDYNGNIGAAPTKSIAKLREHALDLMEAFFDGMHSSGIKAERWIIATSPGFCSARHWQWLLDELSKQIRLAS